MISAKLYNREDELRKVKLELEKIGIDLPYSYDRTVVCQVSDHITKECIYLVASHNSENLLLDGYLISNEKEYLIDCGVRMIVNYFYRMGYESVTLSINNSCDAIRKCLYNIKFALVDSNMNRSTFELSSKKFYESTC